MKYVFAKENLSETLTSFKNNKFFYTFYTISYFLIILVDVVLSLLVADLAFRVEFYVI